MKLNKFDYFSDYVAYPVAILAVGTVVMGASALHANLEWLAAVGVGFALWTLLEYALHRVVLHGRNYFAPMHGEHHAAPRAYIGTPTWISLPTLAGAVLLPLSVGFGFHWASAIFTGIMTGYVWYGAVHHLIHHRADADDPPLLRKMRARHMRHHYSPKAGNFGVTTALWDHVFRTTIRREPAAAGR